MACNAASPGEGPCTKVLTGVATSALYAGIPQHPFAMATPLSCFGALASSGWWTRFAPPFGFNLGILLRWCLFLSLGFLSGSFLLLLFGKQVSIVLDTPLCHVGQHSLALCGYGILLLHNSRTCLSPFTSLPMLGERLLDTGGKGGAKSNLT